MALGLFVGCASVPERPVVPSLSGQTGGAAQAGDFVWHDLVTPDASGAVEFYGDLLGWTFVESSEGYFEAYADGDLVGGIVDGRMLGVAPQSALWLTSLATDDIEGALAKLSDAGGRVLAEPGYLPDRGVVAQVEDPEGAIVQLVEIGSTARLPDPRVWIWHELLTSDPSASAAWYAKFEGVQVRLGSRAGQYEVLEGGSVKATISESPFEATRSVWVPVVAVDDAEVVVEKVSQMGGRVIIAPSPDLANGTLALILDPSNGLLAVQSREVLQ